MNCQQFETIITGLARKKAIVEATARESGLAHTKTCPRCASRLADEQSLSDGLRAVALASKGTEEAPPRIETALRAAFREGRATPASRAAVASPIAAPLSRRRWPSQQSARPVAAAAAMVLLMIGLLVATRLLRTPPAGPVEQGARGVASQSVMPQGTPAPDG